MESKKIKIIFPMPGDKPNTPIPLGKSDDGNFTFQMEFRRPGRYVGHVTVQDANGQIAKSNSVTIQVLPDVGSRGMIREQNRLLRAAIRAAMTVKEVDEQKERSRFIVDMAEGKLKSDALKEFEDTTKVASKRLDELRTIESDRWVGVGVHHIGVGGSSKKKKTTVL